MPMLDDILTYLDAQSTALSILSGTGGNLVKQMMLDSTRAPDTLTILYKTAGVANGYTFSTSTGGARVAWERPGLQILSRSTSAATAEGNAETVYTILDGLSGQNLPTATGTLYLDIEAVQAPFFTERDRNDRFVFSANFLVRKQIG